MSAEDASVRQVLSDAPTSLAPEEGKSLAFSAAGKRYQRIGVEIEPPATLLARTLTDPKRVEDFRLVVVIRAPRGVVPVSFYAQLFLEEIDALLQQVRRNAIKRGP